MRVVLVLAALLLTQCGVPPEIKVASQWQATEDPCRHVYKLVVESADGAVIEAGGRRMIATPFVEGDGRPRATLTWAESELPASQLLKLRVTDRSTVRELEHRIPGLPPGVAFLLPTDRPGPSLPVSARVQVVDTAGVRQGPQIVVSMDSGQLRFDIPACRVGEATSGIGSAEVRGKLVRYSLPVREALRLTRSSQPEGPMAILPLALLNGAGKTDIQIQLALDALAHAAFRELPERPFPDFSAHNKGDQMVMVMYAHRADHPRAVRFVGPRTNGSGEATAVAVGHLSLSTVERCRYGFLLQTLVAGRVRRDIQVTVYEAKTGRILAAKKFLGKTPPECPAEMKGKFAHGQASLEESLDGEQASDDDVIHWLERV